MEFTINGSFCIPLMRGGISYYWPVRRSIISMLIRFSNGASGQLAYTMSTSCLLIALASRDS